MPKLDSKQMTERAKNPSARSKSPLARRAAVERDIVALQIEDFPLSLKRKVVAKAEADHSNMNDVAVSILAAKFRVPFEASGRVRIASDSSTVMFRMPRALRRVIRNTAISNDLTARDLVISVLTAAL